jgi:hypothetical protein
VSVQQRYGNDLESAERERTADPEQRDLRYAAATRRRIEDVGEGAAQILERAIVGVARNRRLLQHVEAAYLVEAEDVIGVTVGEQNRIDARDAVGQRLFAQIGGSIHQHTADAAHVTVRLEENRWPGAAIARVVRVADGAGAANHRHAVRGAGAEQRDLKAQ